MVQKWQVFQLFFLRQWRPGLVFYDILERKNAFLGYKKEKFKETTSNFFFLGNIGHENVIYGILEQKNASQDYKKKKFKKTKNWYFLKGLTMVLFQKWPFFQLFFLRQWRPGLVFYDILERKNAFLGYKKEKFKKTKNWHFLKGLTHGFVPKMAIFPTIFFRQYTQGKCFCVIF